MGRTWSGGENATHGQLRAHQVGNAMASETDASLVHDLPVKLVHLQKVLLVEALRAAPEAFPGNARVFLGKQL